MKKTSFTISLLFNIILIIVLTFIVVYKTDLLDRWSAMRQGLVYVPIRTDNDCVRSWNTFVGQLNYDADVVFFGNSITEGGDWQEVFDGLRVCNLGYIGEDTKGMLRRVVQISSLHPEKVFVMAGVNGLKHQTMDEFEVNYSNLLDSIIKVVPDADIYLESILPVAAGSSFCQMDKIVSANTIISEYASKNNLIYIDLYHIYSENGSLPDSCTYDGVHLNKSAYFRWYNLINDYIYN